VAVLQVEVKRLVFVVCRRLRDRACHVFMLCSSLAFWRATWIWGNWCLSVRNQVESACSIDLALDFATGGRVAAFCRIQYNYWMHGLCWGEVEIEAACEVITDGNGSKILSSLRSLGGAAEVPVCGLPCAR
jgi:hypothetical protein